MTSRAGAAERNAVMQGSPANLTNAIDIVRSPHPAAGLPRTLRTPITHGAKYFDVTGAEPDSVVYNAGGTDLAVWVTPAPAPRDGGASTGASRTPGTSSSGSGSAAAAAVPTEQEPGLVPATPAASGADGVPQGSSGAPLPGSSGTPLPTGSTGTPVGAPAPEAATAEAPGSSGTPVEGQPHGPAPASPAPPAPPAQGQPAAAIPSEAPPASAAPATTAVVPPPGA